MNRSERAFQDWKEYLGRPPRLSKPEPWEALRLYLVASDFSISSVLFWCEDGAEKPVYFTSKTLLDVETLYTRLEKVVLALVYSSQKLRPYFFLGPRYPSSKRIPPAKCSGESRTLRADG